MMVAELRLEPGGALGHGYSGPIQHQSGQARRKADLGDGVPVHRWISGLPNWRVNSGEIEIPRLIRSIRRQVQGRNPLHIGTVTELDA